MLVTYAFELMRIRTKMMRLMKRIIIGCCFRLVRKRQDILCPRHQSGGIKQNYFRQSVSLSVCSSVRFTAKITIEQ